MQHELKADLINFARLKDGTKTFEKCDNGNQYQFGDILKFREFNDEKINSVSDAPKGYTSAEPLYFKVGFIYNSGSSVTLSLLPHKPAPESKVDKPKIEKSKTRKKSK